MTDSDSVYLTSDCVACVLPPALAKKERPILFSGPMVRALLAGKKTQTRRALRRQPYSVALVESGNHLFDYRFDLSDYSRVVPMDKAVTLSPYGVPGDRLWVRENGWQRPERTPKMMREGADTWEPYYFDADGLREQESADFKAWGFKRRPSIHMPRAHSRILLEVTEVRVQRLQDIDYKDAEAEGVARLPLQDGENHPWWTADVGAGAALHSRSATGAYHKLWEAINGPGSWDANPWVWAVSFEVVPSEGREQRKSDAK